MNPDEVKTTLQRFHALERNQVALYQAQALLTGTDVDKQMFMKLIRIESGHVEVFVQELERRGWSPAIYAPLGTVVGGILGTSKSITLTTALKGDIEAENEAMKMYMEFIQACDDPRLKDVLWSNLLEESLHTEWLKARLINSVDKLPVQ